MNIGHVKETWLYPIKSMAGQRVEALSLDGLGVVGDRAWSMLDAESGDVAWGKRFPRVMDLEASYVGERPTQRVFGDAVPPVRIRVPGGAEVNSDAEADGPISDYVGSPLRLSPRSH